MTVSLAQLAQTKHALRIDDGDLISDDDIERLIMVASELVISYLKTRVIEVTTDPDTSPPTTEIVMNLDASPPIIPARATQATIMCVGYLYRSPDADTDKDWQMGFIPRPVMALLYPLREPTLV